MRHILYILPLMAIISCACKRVLTEPTPPDNGTTVEKHPTRNLVLTDEEQQMNVQTNAFALNMLTQIVRSEEPAATPNICFSPVSANMALGILLNGASGSTYEEMRGILGFTDTPEEQINAYYRKLVEALPYLDSTTVVKIANALWLKKEFPVKADYKQLTQATFDATVDNVRTFTDDAVLDMINRWAADNTNNLIKKVIDRDMVSEDLMMVFANALYFKGIWLNKFDKADTRKENFTTSFGTTEKKDMMTKFFSGTEARYMDIADAQLLELAYEGDKYCMDIILPAEGKQPSDVLAALTPDKWSEIEQQIRYSWHDVDVWLPRFKYTYDRSLISDLQALGIHAAFTPSADFSRLSDIPTHLGFLNQYCYISVDEQGTEAAAVTIGGVYATSAGPEPGPKVFHATRPFLYIIRERQYGTILFCGVVGAPD